MAKKIDFENPKLPPGKKRIDPYKSWVGAMVPNWLLKRCEVSPGAKLVYARLCEHSGREGNGRAYPGQKVLADELGISARQIRRYIVELEKHELIYSIQYGLRLVNSYVFLWHEWMEFRVSG